jgi:anaphase-promoting complex subunit 3
LGQVFEKLGKYEIARDHYKNAAMINPTNPVLKVCIGLVLEKTASQGNRMERNQHRDMALQMYDEACDLDARSYRARFSKARVLLSLGRAAEAREELEQLKNLFPDDSPVHYLLGKIYMRFRDKANAIRHLTIAMNLDPKVCILTKKKKKTNLSRLPTYVKKHYYVSEKTMMMTMIWIEKSICLAF